MIYKFKLLSPEISDFYCDIEIKSNQTFYTLHNYIQDIVNYDSSQLASFFLTNKKWEKEMLITILDMADEENQNMVMDKTKIGDLVKEKGQKLLYVYDFFSERSFFIEMVSIRDDDNEHYPVCTASGGEVPEQIKLGDTSMNNIFEDDDEYSEVDDEKFDDMDHENIDDYDEFK